MLHRHIPKDCDVTYADALVNIWLTIKGNYIVHQETI